MYGVKETECTRCGHRDICSIKDNYLKARKAIDDAAYGTGDNTIMRVRNNKHFTVTLRCSHCIPDQHYRNAQPMRGEE